MEEGAEASTRPAADPLPDHLPLSTYRLQLHAGFGFQELGAVASYLADLGISDLYLSPIFQTSSPSSHGYDVCDFAQLNRFLGSSADFEWCYRECQQRQFHWILDFVPNHMGISSKENRWWLDVLEHGRNSPWAKYFDIAWSDSFALDSGKLILPVLGDLYGKVLEAGELKIIWEPEGFFVRYYQKQFPLGASFYFQMADWLLAEIATTDDDLREGLQRWKQSAATELRQRSSSDPPAERGPFENPIRSTFQQLLSRSLPAQAPLARLLKELNGIPGKPSSFDRLHSVLEEQSYRLMHWRSGSAQLNYRRFFDINDLAALRMEEAGVFSACHALLFEWIGQGKVSGIRIDHPDGLADPGEYFERPQQTYARTKQTSAIDRQPGNKSAGRLYVIAEKILCEEEELPADWRTDGTTGYDFLNELNGLFVAGENAPRLRRIYRRLTRQRARYELVVRDCKRWVLEHLFAAELRRLTRDLQRIALSDRSARDFTLEQVRAAIMELIVHLPVYRTYRTVRQPALSAQCRAYLQRALAATRQENAPALTDLWNFFLQIFSMAPPEEDKARRRWQDWIARFQQLSGPVMAKGVEDTAFYRFIPLISLNEVGGNPDRFGIELEEFHRFNERRAARWPRSLSATATHDTKRGEDTRARINVLSEMPREWELAVCRWRRLNRSKRTPRRQAPSGHDEYFLYQSLVGAWPFSGSRSGAEEWVCFCDRMAAYMRKAARESKRETSWIDPPPAYEEALEKFVRAVLDRQANSEFILDFEAFQRRVSFFGIWNSLAQVALKCMSPGVPDVYQGTERWDFSLVDPDNRRPVDFGRSQMQLQELDATRWDVRALAGLLKSPEDGRLKLFVVSRLLRLRKAKPELFQEGCYLALAVNGDFQRHLCAFARIYGNSHLVVAVPRWVATLGQGATQVPIGNALWGDTRVQIPRGFPALTDLWTGRRTICAQNPALEIKAGALLQDFPVAVWFGQSG